MIFTLREHNYGKREPHNEKVRTGKNDNTVIPRVSFSYQLI